MAIRLDAGKLGKCERTTNGGAKIPASLTSVGVFEYRDANGAIRREFKPPEEVFAPATMKSLKNAAVTNLHPNQFVDPANYNTLAVGHVDSEKIVRNGNLLDAELVLTDAAMIALIDAGDRREVSLGFSCTLDPTPGVWQGIKYDAVQRNIIHNHAAIGPTNWGRCGNNVALRVDGQDDIQAGEVATTATVDSKPAPKQRIHMLPKIKYSDCGGFVTIDDVEYPLKGDAKQATQALKSAHDRSRGARRSDATAEHISLEDSLVAAEATSLAFAVRNANPTTPAFPQEKIDSLVKSTLTVLDRARSCSPKGTKFDSLTPNDIMKAALAANGFDLKKLDGKSSDYLEGLFDALKVDAAPADDEEEGEEGEPKKKSTFEKVKDQRSAVADSNEPKTYTAAEYRAMQQRKIDEAATAAPLNRSISIVRR